MIRMLIVDDFIETAESLSQLYSLNKDVEIVGLAQNAEQLWQFLREQEVHFVSLDIEIGHENGLELCQVLHEKYPNIFIVMCSIEATIENIRRATEAGAAYFLAKPISMKVVSEVLLRYSDYKREMNETVSPLTDENIDELLNALK
ncbi:response regulator transcription factor [Alicyclobacillus mengziensis]|uniref:Response regulator n=1 Tax=Alicyclobacillus mengziensis TaxID=2931921 RepID=A0A9X7W127_9BACL|nr:response regulator [Alicyclobacillus mengziensis]QSO48359.1 response regulator [Alicyclobacillus mengziensis]